MQYSLHSLCHLTKASGSFPGCFLVSEPQPSSPAEQIRKLYLKSTFTIPSEFWTTNNWGHLFSAGWKLTLSPSSGDGMQKCSAYWHVPCGPRRKDALSGWAHLWATLSTRIHTWTLHLLAGNPTTWTNHLFFLKVSDSLISMRGFFLGGGSHH